MTMNEFLKSRGQILTDIAVETGLSVSMISKLKNGKIPITKKTREIFEEKYDVTLTEINESSILQEKIQKLEIELDETKSRLYESKDMFTNTMLVNSRKNMMMKLMLLPDAFWEREDTIRLLGKFAQLKDKWSKETL